MGSNSFTNSLATSGLLISFNFCAQTGETTSVSSLASRVGALTATEHISHQFNWSPNSKACASTSPARWASRRGHSRNVKRAGDLTEERTLGGDRGAPGILYPAAVAELHPFIVGHAQLVAGDHQGLVGVETWSLTTLVTEHVLNPLEMLVVAGVPEQSTDRAYVRANILRWAVLFEARHGSPKMAPDESSRFVA